MTATWEDDMKMTGKNWTTTTTTKHVMVGYMLAMWKILAAHFGARAPSSSSWNHIHCGCRDHACSRNHVCSVGVLPGKEKK